MGEKQIRAHADKLGADALRPMFESLQNLAVAADAASREAEVRARARAQAQRILDDAEAEIARRYEDWRRAWQAARDAGWTIEKLRAEPINQRQPPAAGRPKKPRTARPIRADADGRAAKVTAESGAPAPVTVRSG